MTAVEYLLEGIINLTGVNIASDEPIVEKAKELYEQEMVKIYEKGMSDGYDFATREAMKEINKHRE